MIARADILVKSENEEPVAIVEIKNRRDLTPAVARQIRRNLLVNGLVRRPGFFLLVSQDRGYVWTPQSSESLDSDPDGEFSMHEIVREYLPEEEPDLRFRENELELIITQWLGDLVADGHQLRTTEPDRVLDELGFTDAVHSGSVLAEPEP